ncbi:hypothetical protein LOTGIDRAFT_103922 [Lottia gigantea]|uniref:BTB domain-containing protein n=1 Tax=Lottia gigantea TaxID=225164 RepID=V4A286_LOTGI|nr:hypothetical protein LOTGIDRAFT_103922 [Lottia gigantea]ESO97953.1 hypothetical protein LOTGIDRAFT_103922 [Lottia gigantea]
MSKKVKLNIGGHVFVTRAETLQRIPHTRLSDLNPEVEEYDSESDEYYFDRDPEVFRPILNMYRSNELHLPRNMCGNALKLEMDYWGIKVENIADCCWKIMYRVKQDSRIGADMREVGESGKPIPIFPIELQNSWNKFRFGLWKFLAKPNSSMAAAIWNTVYFGLILLSVSILVVESHKAFRIPNNDINMTSISFNISGKYRLYYTTQLLPILYYLDVFCVSIFTIELSLHFLTSPYKLLFLKSWLNLLDALVIIANWCNLIVEQNYGKELVSLLNRDLITAYRILKYISILRILRFFKLTERFHSLKIMTLAIKQSFRELFMMFMFIIVIATLYGCALFIMEFESEELTDIPIAIWWAIITMTTVGYGDIIPKSDSGRVIGVFCAISGLMVLSMPVAIIASNFSDYHERDTDRRMKISHDHEKRIHCENSDTNKCKILKDFRNEQKTKMIMVESAK